MSKHAWISTKHGLPEYADNYLTIDKTGVHVRYYSCEYGWNHDYGDVYYWTTLPELPVKFRRCKGEGQGSCKRCNDNNIWNRSWMAFLYKIEGREGCYCRDCVSEIIREESEKEE